MTPDLTWLLSKTVRDLQFVPTGPDLDTDPDPGTGTGPHRKRAPSPQPG